MANVNNVHLNVRLNSDKFQNNRQVKSDNNKSGFGESIFNSTAKNDRFGDAFKKSSSSPFGGDYVQIDVRQMAIDAGQQIWHPIALYFPRDVAEELGLPLMEDRGKAKEKEEPAEPENIDEMEEGETDDLTSASAAVSNNPFDTNGYLFPHTSTYKYDDGTVEEEFVDPNAKEGDVFIKRTITKPDGTVEVIETIKGKDYNNDTTKTTKRPDGTTEVEKTVKNDDGSYTTTTEITKADGSTTTVKVTDYPDDTWVKETIDENGNVTKEQGKYSNDGV